ncbi:MAG: DUF4105 domain-containing protein [Myxococcota bacterium]
MLRWSFLLGLVLCLVGRAAFASLPPWATGESHGEDLVVSLATFGPGDDVASWFGHTALVVEDRRLNHARLYNYGMFKFDETMLARFAMGRLTFWVGEDGVMSTLRFYQYLDRDVRIQELNLVPERRLVLAKALADNVLPQNREYRYHHYDDNCATRPRDLIDRVIDGQLKQATGGPARMSLRDHTRRHSAVSPPMSLLLDFLMNDEIDRPITQAQEAFLPEELEKQVAALSYLDATGKPTPLVARSWTYFDAARPPLPKTPPAYGPWMLLLGTALGVLPLALGLRGLARRGPRIAFALHSALVGLVLGLPGLALFIMWVATEHTVTWRNENLFFANPFTFAALPLGIAAAVGSQRARRWLFWLWRGLAAVGLLGLCVKVIPVFNQDNWRLIALLLPVGLGCAAASWLERKQGGEQK